MITTSQVSVASTAATLVGIIPAGAASVVVTNSSGTVPVFLGTGATQPGTAPSLTSSGVPVAGGAVVSLSQYTASGSSHLWGQSSSGTIPVGLIISTGV
jgi:hypothetical protein